MSNRTMYCVAICAPHLYRYFRTRSRQTVSRVLLAVKQLTGNLLCFNPKKERGGADMAQWNGMEQAATIAQLVGVDALGLISTIVQAAQTVQRNKETCQELVQDVQLINGLLRMLQNPEMI